LIASTTRAQYGERLTPASIQPMIDMVAKYGHFAPFPANVFIYAEPVNPYLAARAAVDNRALRIRPTFQ
jgi:hypothetical protein